MGEDISNNEMTNNANKNGQRIQTNMFKGYRNMQWTHAKPFNIINEIKTVIERDGRREDDGGMEEL